jgi:hypothetical protein
MALNGWKDRSRRRGGHRTTSGESKNVIAEGRVNTTLVLQPMDQGIIRSQKQKNFTGTLFASSCRESHYQRMLQSTFFDAIFMLAAIWSAVIWETTANCYWKARFCETSELHNENDD